MFKSILKLIESSCLYIKTHKKLNVFSPVADALDSFFLGSNEKTNGYPHILSKMDLKRYMSIVIIALIPSFLGSIYYYGYRVILVLLISYIFGGLTEVIFSILRKKPIYEGFLVTGFIFPLIMPPSIPLWMVAIGIIFGVFFGKEVFGGTGRNIFNPALVGRIFLSLAFPSYFSSMWQVPFTEGFGGFLQYSSDIITKATPLIIFKSSKELTDLSILLLGSHAGCIGETFRLGIIIGGLFLIFAKISDFRIPLFYILTVFIFSSLLNLFNPSTYPPGIFAILSGGLMFGAFFMATDPVTAPITKSGKIIYGILGGLITVLIRSYSGFSEGVMFSILLMNAFAPMIDLITINIMLKGTNYDKKD